MSDFISILPLIEILERNKTSARLICSAPESQYELWIDSGKLVHWESEPEEAPEKLLSNEIYSIWMRPLKEQAEFKAAKEPLKLYELVKKSYDFDASSKKAKEGKSDKKSPDASKTKKIEGKAPPTTSSPADDKTTQIKSKPPAFSLLPETPDKPDKLKSKQKEQESSTTVLTTKLNDHVENWEAETAPVPSLQPPPPAPPVVASKPAEEELEAKPPVEGLPKPAMPVTVDVDPPKPKPEKARESVFIDKTEGNLAIFTKGKKERRVAGRAEDCDMVIKDTGASRRHCELYFDGTLIHVKDLNSSNGTYLNDKQVHMAVADDGDKLEIGDVEFILKVGESPASEVV